MSKPTAQEAAEAIMQLARKGPKMLEMLTQALDNPRRAIEALDLLIRADTTSSESRKRYQDLRNSLETFAVEEQRK